MLGFPFAVLDELNSGESLLAQLSPTHLPTIFAAFVLFVAASLVPVLKDNHDESFGPFNPKVDFAVLGRCMYSCRRAWRAMGKKIGITTTTTGALLPSHRSTP